MANDDMVTVDELQFQLSARAAVAKLLRVDVERLEPDASLVDDLKVDSLDFITLIVGLESHFDISFPDYEAAQIRTVSGLLDLLLTRMIRERSSQ